MRDVHAECLVAEAEAPVIGIAVPESSDLVPEHAFALMGEEFAKRHRQMKGQRLHRGVETQACPAAEQLSANPRQFSSQHVALQAGHHLRVELVQRKLMIQLSALNGLSIVSCHDVVEACGPRARTAGQQ